MSINSFRAVWTDGAKIQAATLVGTGAAIPTITNFKVGLGGYNSNGSIRAPDPSLTNLDIIQNPARYPEYASAGYTTKYYTGVVGSFSNPEANVLRVPCLLLVSDYNSDGVGFPLIREIGLFDTLGTMVAYGTFGGIRKNPSKQVAFNVDLVF